MSVRRTHLLLTVVLIVTALFWVPVAVRATQQVNAGRLSSTLRLNRGFDMPVERVSIAPADQPSLVPAAVTRQEAATIAARRPVIHRDDALPPSPEAAPPDPLRGPPSVSIA